MEMHESLADPAEAEKRIFYALDASLGEDINW